jgi:D-alanyl-D-alanine carboxypeptidase
MLLPLLLSGAMLTGVLTATAPPTFAADPSPLQQSLDAIVATGIPGATGFVRDGAETHSAAAGMGRLGPAEPMRADDRVRVGSITKTFTATVVLQLVGEHRIGLDDPIAERLPGLLPNGSAITVRDLLQHRSGLFDYATDPNFVSSLFADPTHVYQPRDLVAIALSHPAVFPPGTRYGYSNTDYVVLGSLIEAVTGHRADREIDRRIIAPLRLTATSFPTTATDLPTPSAHGYVINGGAGAPTVDTTHTSPTIAWTAGAIISDAADVATFYHALLSGHLLRPAQLAEMETMVPTNDPNDPGEPAVGLGIFTGTLSCGPALEHTGDFPGFATFAFNSTDGRRQVVISVNADSNFLTSDQDQAVLNALNQGFCQG